MTDFKYKFTQVLELISQAKKERLLTDDERKKIKDHIISEEPDLTIEMEKYNKDNDLSGLVETLKLLAGITAMSSPLDNSLFQKKRCQKRCQKRCVIYIDDIIGAGGYEYIKKIYIKFIKTSNKFSNCNSLSDLNGLLKLCLLSEISSKLDLEQIKQMPEIIYYIMQILKNGYIETIRDTKKNIKEVLEKVKGSNVINFSNFVEEEINLTDIKTMINFLDNNHKTEIKDINYRLSKYNKYIKLFDKEFEKSRKERIFEFSVVSLVIIEREDFEKFEKEREKCPNRVEKIYISWNTD